MLSDGSAVSLPTYRCQSPKFQAFNVMVGPAMPWSADKRRILPLYGYPRADPPAHNDAPVAGVQFFYFVGDGSKAYDGDVQ